MGVTILMTKKYGNENRAMAMGINFHCSFSTYHMRFCSVCELGKHSPFTLARPSPEHVMFTSLMCTVTDWRAIIVNDFVCSF